MPFESYTPAHVIRERILLTGPPNSGKTTSLVTFLGEGERGIYIAYPGEHGTGSLAPVEGLTPYIWTGTVGVGGWGAVAREVRQETQRLIKEGADVFMGDGLHKLYQIFLAEVTNGESMKSYDFDSRLYGAASSRFISYLHDVVRAPFKRVIFTVWDGREKDDPDAKDKDTQKHIFPELPGRLAKDIMGEFPVVLYATIQGLGVAARYLWQTRPQGKVWGCGVKAPLSVTAKIPPFIPQDWGGLASMIGLPFTPRRGGPTVSTSEIGGHEKGGPA